MIGFLITLLIVVVVGCAIMAAMGFKGRVSTVGVDLGTTFSVVGVNIDGKVVIVSDKQGHNIFPSIVSYQDHGIFTGYQALPFLSSHPTRTIFNAKRFIGKSITDDDMPAYAAAHPFKVVASTLSNYSKVAFSMQVANEEKLVTPEQVGTQVLKYLMELTAQFLGHNQVNKAVIAVPAKFSSLQREATASAYKNAGLKVVRVLEEPTAAAVAYQLHKKTNIHHILVYDFGGGTLDVSLLYVSKGSVQVYATDGDDLLGGSDLDFCLFNFIKDRIATDAGFHLLSKDELEESSQQEPNTQERSDKLCTSANVRNQAEDIKKRLSSNTTAHFRCEIPTSDTMSAPTTVYFDITRTQFESSCAPLFERGMLPVQRLLSELGMTAADIDEVVLVGGTTRIPRVKEDLRAFFGKELNDHIDPDVTVAYGAASVLD